MLAAVRYLLPALVVIGGIVGTIVRPDLWEGAAAIVGAGLSIALLNVLHRVGVRGEDDRVREQAARAYFDTHGRWPEDDAAQRTSESRP